MRFQEYLIEAGSLPREDRAGKLAWLNKADVELTKLRFELRLCRDLKLLDPGQHRHVSQMMAEIGRFIGGLVQSPGQYLPEASHSRPAPISTGKSMTHKYNLPNIRTLLTEGFIAF